MHSLFAVLINIDHDLFVPLNEATMTIKVQMKKILSQLENAQDTHINVGIQQVLSQIGIQIKSKQTISRSYRDHKNGPVSCRHYSFEFEHTITICIVD